MHFAHGFFSIAIDFYHSLRGCIFKNLKIVIFIHRITSLLLGNQMNLSSVIFYHFYKNVVYIHQLKLNHFSPYVIWGKGYSGIVVW